MNDPTPSFASWLAGRWWHHFRRALLRQEGSLSAMWFYLLCIILLVGWMAGKSNLLAESDYLSLRDREWLAAAPLLGILLGPLFSIIHELYTERDQRPSDDELVRRAKRVANRLISRAQALLEHEDTRRSNYIMAWWEDVRDYLAYTSQPSGTGERWHAILEMTATWEGEPTYIFEPDDPDDHGRYTPHALGKGIDALRDFRDSITPDQLNLDRFWDEPKWSVGQVRP